MFSQMCMGAAKAAGPKDPSIPTAFDQLREALAEVTGTATSEVDESLLAVAWSTAHGAASLICDGVWTKEDPKAQAAMAEICRMAQSKAKKKAKRRRQTPAPLKPCDAQKNLLRTVGCRRRQRRPGLIGALDIRCDLAFPMTQGIPIAE